MLTPSLESLKRRLPETDIRLFTQTDTNRLSLVDRDERLDVVVTYGPADGRMPGLVAHRIADVAIVPVQAAGAPAIATVDELFARPLIHVIGPFEGWVRWCERFCPARPMSAFALETDS